MREDLIAAGMTVLAVMVWAVAVTLLGL